MDSYETVQYSSFNSKKLVNKNSRMAYDICDNNNMSRDEKMSTKPMKYYLHDFFNQTPCDSSDLTKLSRGINFTNGFGFSTAEIDLGSQFRVGQKTTKKLYGDLPPAPLPTTASFLSGQGNISIEDSKIRAINGKELKACNPKDSHFYNRSFYLFPEGVIQNPMEDITHIVPATLECGIATKSIVTEKYKRG